MPPEDSFEAIVAPMSKKQLIKFAAEKLSYRIDEKLEVEEMRKAIILINDAMARQAEKQNAESTKRMASSDDPEVKFKFLNLENQGMPQEFSSDGGRGIEKDKKSGVVGKVPYYKFFHGKEHTAPLSIVEMLNSLTVPAPRYNTEAASEQVSGAPMVTKRNRNRFSCQIILSEEQKRAMSA